MARAAERGAAAALTALAALNERLKVAEATARRERELAFQAAQVDDSAAGARRWSYKMRHDGAFHATLRRLDAMKRMRWAGLAGDEEEEAGATATEPSLAGTSDGDGLGVSDLGVASNPITPVTNDPIGTEIIVSIWVATTNSVQAETSNPISPVTSRPISPVTPLDAGAGVSGSENHCPSDRRLKDRPLLFESAQEDWGLRPATASREITETSLVLRPPHPDSRPESQPA